MVFVRGGKRPTSKDIMQSNTNLSFQISYSSKRSIGCSFVDSRSGVEVRVEDIHRDERYGGI